MVSYTNDFTRLSEKKGVGLDIVIELIQNYNTNNGRIFGRDVYLARFKCV